MADDDDRARGRGLPADQAEEAVRGRSVHARLERDRWFGAEFCLRELPRLAGTAGGGAQDTVGNATGLAEPASGGRGIPAATPGQRPVMIRDAAGPGGLGMSEQNKPPHGLFAHALSLPGRAGGGQTGPGVLRADGGRAAWRVTAPAGDAALNGSPG